MLLPTAFLLLASLLPTSARNVAHKPKTSRAIRPRAVSVQSPTPFQAASPLITTSHVLTLSTKNNGKPSGAATLLKHDTITVGNSTGLISLFLSEEFATNVTFGDQTFEFIVDTGSSDTWVIETGFACVDVETEEPETEDYCAFGPTYTLSADFVEIPGEVFSIGYGDGEFLTGIFGYENVTLAGLSVNTTVPVVNYAGWYGDGETSGLLGLAYPGITSAYSNTTNESIVYDPIFFTLYKEGLIAPLFSLAIERDLSGPAGYLALGGVPSVDFVPDFTSTPILITEISGYPETYDFYTINLDSVVLDNVSLPLSGGDIQYIVDSGTTLNYFPTAVADAIAAAYVPAAVYEADEGAYIVDCDAVAPGLGITINGTTFWTNPIDMILLAGTDDEGNDVCISGIDDGGDDLAEDVYILGDTFLKNVIAVFDVGAVELQFAAREYYESNNPSRKRGESVWKKK